MLQDGISLTSGQIVVTVPPPPPPTTPGTPAPVVTSFTLPYDIVIPIFGKPKADDIIFRFKTPRVFTIPANFAGSIAHASTPATTKSDFIVQVNGTVIMKITFNPGSNTGVFSMTSEKITLNVGDVMLIVAPQQQDATLEQLDFSILATL